MRAAAIASGDSVRLEDALRGPRSASRSGPPVVVVVGRESAAAGCGGWRAAAGARTTPRPARAGSRGFWASCQRIAPAEASRARARSRSARCRSCAAAEAESEEAIEAVSEQRRTAEEVPRSARGARGISLARCLRALDGAALELLGGLYSSLSGCARRNGISHYWFEVQNPGVASYPSPPTDVEISPSVAITGGGSPTPRRPRARAPDLAGPGDSAGRVVSGTCGCRARVGSRAHALRRTADDRAAPARPEARKQAGVREHHALRPAGHRLRVGSLCAPLQRRCPLANVTHSVVFLKTYKTGGSTFANVLQRYARNRELPMARRAAARCATGQAIFRCDGPADSMASASTH